MTQEQFNNLKDGQLIYVQDHFYFFNSEYRTDEGLKLYFLTYKPEQIKLVTKEMVEEYYQKELKQLNENKEKMLKAIF